MLRVSSTLSIMAFTILAGTALHVSATLAQTPPPSEKDRGVRGRVVVAPELLAATEWPVDAARAAALRTPANSRRGQGRKLQPMMEALPDIAVVVEGEDVRADTQPPKTIVLEGMRFVPGQALLARPGPIALENKQGIPVTIVDAQKHVLKTLAVGETAQINLPEGLNTLTMKELPYAAASVRVLSRGRFLVVDDAGELAQVPLSGGDYTLSFYLGANELRRQPLQVPENGQLFIDATISANTVVDVSVKDASVQIAVPPNE
jgi:hypothetical protein